jgi:(S)-2-hydroxyglutarate dehydrogenase
MWGNVYDFIVIGGGIVGLSVGMELVKRQPRIRIAILEKESDLAYHQTGHNSGVIHSGIYYKPGSFKAKFCREGYNSMVNFCQEHEVPFDICGKVIIATHRHEIPLLENLHNQGLENGIKVSKLNVEEVKEIEPYVSCLAGIKVFSTGIVDYRQVCLKMAALYQLKGGEVYSNTKVEKITDKTHTKLISTTNETFETRFLINCAGLHSDRISKLGNVDPKSKIIPFRGEYYELTSEKQYLVKHLIYPVPNPKFPFLGVHFTRMINSHIHAGPNAVLSFKREGYKKTDFDLNDFKEVVSYPGFWKFAVKHADEGFQEIVRSFSKAMFIRSLQRMIPEIQDKDLIPAGSGVRAQALMRNGNLVDDFLIVKGQNSVHVCNAPSPAATSSIEIGRSIADIVAKDFYSLTD